MITITCSERGFNVTDIDLSLRMQKGAPVTRAPLSWFNVKGL
jgi:hypothetical protein